MDQINFTHFNFSFANNESLRTQHLEASKHYRDLVIKESRYPEDWTDEDNTKISWVFEFILAISIEMQKREREAAEHEADIADAEAMEEQEFDQDDFEAERRMVGDTAGAGAGAGVGADVGAGAADPPRFKPPQHKMLTLEEMLALPAERQIHYRCNYCEAPALEGSYDPGRYCTWDCYTKNNY